MMELKNSSLNMNEDPNIDDDNFIEHSTEDPNPTSSLLGIKLSPGIKRFNLMSFYLCFSSSIMNMEFLYTFGPLILNSPKYYNIPLKKVPQIVGLSALAA